MKHKLWKRLCAALLVTAMTAGSIVSASACTGLYVGKASAANGSTYVGRSEDAGKLYDKVFQVKEAADHEEQAGSIDELDLETGASAGKLVAVVAEAALVIEEELLFDAGIAAGVRLAGTALDDREAVCGAALECQGACGGGACHDLSPSFVCVEQPCYTHWLRRRNQAEQLFDGLYSTRTSVRFKRICEHLFEILEIMPYNRSQVTNRRLCHGV